MTCRGIIQWVRRCLGLEGRHQPAPPSRGTDQYPPPASTAESRQKVKKPSERELEVVQSSSGMGMPPPGNNQEPTQAGAAGVDDHIQTARTQFSGHSRETTDLVIGLDFGTLSTRVIIRSPYVGDGRAVPVVWQVRAEMPPHFLPVALLEGPNGTLTLTSDWTDREAGNLKTDLMDRPDDATVRARAAAYLSLVLREARCYVLDTQAEAYGSYRIRWAVHLGIPSAGYDDDEIKRAFLSVARTAWMLSRRSEPMTLDAAMMELEAEGHAKAIEADPDVTGIEVVPEIAALVVGYARSRRRKEGLHMIMDIGASTIDICGFGLEGRDGDDQYFLYTALVRRFGIRELHHRRMDAIRNANLEDSVRVPASLDPFSEVPAVGSDYVEAPADRLRTELDSLDCSYSAACTQALMIVLKDLKTCRDPRSLAWKTGLPLFKTGGGSRHRLITRAVQEANFRLTTLSGAARIDVQTLPTLETLALARNRSRDLSAENGGEDGSGQPRAESSTDADWEDWDALAERLGVAYGLSFDRFEIGDITPPREIDNVPPMPLGKPTEYISKDHV